MRKYVVFPEPYKGPERNDPLIIRNENTEQGHCFRDYDQAKRFAENLLRLTRFKVGIYELKFELDFPITISTPEGDKDD